MARRIVVIDYGMGNLRSVSKAVEHVAGDAEVLVTDDPGLIASAERVVFPGQGAARDCMRAIGEHQLRRAVLEAAQTKPFLGICMGMQVLLQHSEENGGTDLLGLYEGEVRRFAGNAKGADGILLKIPQMGWNRVRPTRDHPLWEGIEPGSRFYFVHSYYVDPPDRSLVAGTTDYGLDYASVIARDNVFAVQFHPEKSAQAGLRLLANFCGWQA
ncbi:MAG: imidazole glycerol phosphate synthase subunit HisH [Gammaproteobacteria bacterium]|jgi:glutamine amidotransferase|nr:imidazole glycerol phosphate synthase subunit HisH [Gammaproteobacteria bacterium]